MISDQDILMMPANELASKIIPYGVESKPTLTKQNLKPRLFTKLMSSKAETLRAKKGVSTSQQT